MSTPRFDVAICAPSAGVLYADSGAEPTGGAELQMMLVARSLAARGLRVCHIVFHADGLPTSKDGVHLVALPPRPPRSDRARHTARMIGSLARADAHVYLQRTAGFETGVVAAYARARRRPFIFSSSSRFALRPPVASSRLNAMCYRFGIQLATDIVAQTEEQARAVERLLGREAWLIRSFCEPSSDGESGDWIRRSPGPEQARSGERTAFLWIGGMIDYKQPLAYLELAERVPEARFLMVAADRGPPWRPLANAVRARASRLPNVRLLDPLPRAGLLAQYERAIAVVNTSTVEGFPNTLLEGWARGALALSLNLDPDGVIERQRLGEWAGGSLDALAAAAREMWRTRREDARRRDVRRYVELHHSPAVVGSRWAELVASRLPARGAVSS